MSQQCASCGGPLNAPPPARPASPRRDRVLATVDDLVSDFLYYGRKEDEDLPAGAIEEAVAAGEVTADEIVGQFRVALEAWLAGG